MKNNNRQLYKVPSKGKVSGVCAGVAEYLDIEVWVVRLIMVALAIGTSIVPVVVGYFVASWLLDEKHPEEDFEKEDTGYGHSRSNYKKNRSQPYRPSVKEVWRKGSDAKTTLNAIKEKMQSIEERTQNLERFVTSTQFQLHREFSKIS